MLLFVQTAMKNINQEYKVETTAMNDLLAKLKVDAPEIADKVAELQKADKWVEIK